MNELLFYIQKLYLVASNFLVNFGVQADESNLVMGIDMSIEGLRAQKYSVGIFVFLVISLIFFSMIIYFYLPKGEEKLKRGEKIMFGSIIAGIFIAIAIGWLQLIDGYLI